MMQEPLSPASYEALEHLTVTVADGVPPPRDATPSLFERIRKIGAGDVGRVYIVRHRVTKELYAMKVLSKDEMVKRNKIQRCLTERQILAAVDHPCIVSLHYSFKTQLYLYFVMDYCAGGEFFRMLRKQPGQRISEDWVRFYAAEVLMALQYLHSLGFVYRDLKPENILLHASGHIMLTDFDLAVKAEPGTAEVVKRSLGSRIKHVFLKDDHTDNIVFHSSEPTLSRNSFVGTPEYIAPEVITGHGHTSAVDWWTFGVLLYEMTFGRTPYAGKTEEITFAKIVNEGEKLKFPEVPMVTHPLKKLIKGLLKRNVKKRLGSKFGASDIMKMPFFQGVKWQLIRNQTPPYIPPLKHPLDDIAFDHMQKKDVDPDLDAECPWAGEMQPMIDPQDQALLIAQAIPQSAQGGGGPQLKRERFLSLPHTQQVTTPTSAVTRERFPSQAELMMRSRSNGSAAVNDPFAGFDEATIYHHRHPPPRPPSSSGLPPLPTPTPNASANATPQAMQSPVPQSSEPSLLDPSEVPKRLIRTFSGNGSTSAGDTSAVSTSSPRTSTSKPRRTAVSFLVVVPQTLFPSQEFSLSILAEKEGNEADGVQNCSNAPCVVAGSCGPFLIHRHKQLDVTLYLPQEFTVLGETHEKMIWTGSGHSKISFWVRSPPTFGRFTARAQLTIGEENHTLGFNVAIGD